MTRLKLTKAQKELMEKILRTVFYQYAVAKVSKKGYFILKRGWLSSPEYLNLIDFAYEFASRAALRGEQAKLGDFKELRSKILEELHDMVRIYHYNRNYDIVDHIWAIYERMYNTPIPEKKPPSKPIPLPESLAAKAHHVVDELTKVEIKVEGELC